jgi:microcystin-dependent protein
MATPYLSQISLFAFGFAPRNWALCNGQLLPINQNQALFALLGTQYGGDGVRTFALPDLRGRVPVHTGVGGTVGQSGGAEFVTLNTSQLPQHGHALRATSDLANTNLPANALPASRPRGGVAMYAAPDAANTVQMHPASVTASGGNQPHDNMQPFLTMNFTIALAGIFPSRN